MASEIRAIEGTFKSTDATVDLTISGFGTPQACIIYMQKMLTTSIPVKDNDSLLYSTVFWDGTRTRTTGLVVREGMATSVAKNYGNDGKAGVGGEGFVEYSISSITDGIRLTKVSNNIARTRYTVLFIKGMESVRVDDFRPNTSNDGTVSVSDPSFQPSGAFFARAECQYPVESMATTLRSDAFLVEGVMTYDGSTINQGSLNWFSDDAQATTSLRAKMSNSRISSLTTLQDLEITSVNSNGFVCTSRDAEASTYRDVAYLAYELPAGEKAALTFEDTPTSTGNETYSGLGITPDHVLTYGFKGTSLNTEYNDQTADSFYVGFFNDNGESLSNGGGESDGASTSAPYVFTSDGDCIFLYDNGASPILEASYSSMAAGSYTLNFSTVMASSAKFMSLAIGEEIESNAEGSATLPMTTADGDANQEFNAEGSGTIPQFTAEGSATQEFSAEGSANLPMLGADGEAGWSFNADGSATLPLLTADGEAELEFNVNGSAVLPLVEASGEAENPQHAPSSFNHWYEYEDDVYEPLGDELDPSF
jgi:hypothetical protein